MIALEHVAIISDLVTVLSVSRYLVPESLEASECLRSLQITEQCSGAHGLLIL